VTGAVVAIAHVIQWPVALAMVWVSAAMLAVAERCQPWPRAGLTLVDISEWCSRVAKTAPRNA
jgi:hypothetical protein